MKFGIIESEEAMDFIKSGPGKLFARPGFQLEKREPSYLGLVELSLFRKDDWKLTWINRVGISPDVNHNCLLFLNFPENKFIDMRL